MHCDDDNDDDDDDDEEGEEARDKSVALSPFSEETRGNMGFEPFFRFSRSA